MARDDHHELLQRLRVRFEQHPQRHAGLAWADVLQRLQGAPDRLAVIARMEATGGEPDVLGQAEADGCYVFCDCAAESPTGRRSLCFDDAALAARKEHKPGGSALGMAAELGISILDEVQYRALQAFGDFDTKTSSWIATPAGVRSRGGALFGDRRYGQVFVYHNGAESYYAARGFRGLVTV